MLIIKISGIIILLFAGITITSEIKKNNYARLVRIEALIELMRDVQLKIDCYALPIPEILARCESRILVDCGISEGQCSSLKELYEKCAVRAESPEGKVLREFCCNIGEGYRETEVKLCEKYIAEMNLLKTDYRSKLPKLNKASAVLCYFILGVIIILMI